MFYLEMKSGRHWVEVGEFYSADEALDCAFDSRFDYRVKNERGDVVTTLGKFYNSIREAL